VKAIRHKLGLSQAEFAQQFGFSVRAVQQWEQRWGLASARLFDVPQEIIDQDFNIAKVIALLATADVAMITFASLVIVPDHGASVGRPVVQPILEAVRPLRSQSKKLPQHHVPNGAIRVAESGAKNERRARPAN